MSFIISTRNLPTISTYAQAKEFFEKVRPVRSWGDNERPLGRRSDRSKRIEKVGDVYNFILYRTAVVTYAPDYVQVIPYPSLSTIVFANCFLPPQVGAFSHHGQMWVAVRLKSGERHYYDDEVIITSDGAGVKAKGIRRHNTEMILDRKKATEVRKTIKPFVVWQSATAKMNPSVLSKWPTGNELRRFFEAPDDINLYPDLGVFDVEKLRLHAYLHFGAYQSVPVPLDRLPRKDPI